MWGRLGPRFAVEALFLVLVAVGLGFADLRPLVIVIVMAGAWLLVSLIELLASRVPRYEPFAERRVDVAAPPPAPAAPAPAAGVDTEPGIPPDVEPEPAAAEAAASEVADAPPKRRWFRRRREPQAEEANDAPEPAAPEAAGPESAEESQTAEAEAAEPAERASAAADA